MPNMYWATSLTGGGSGALDAIDGTDLADTDSALVVTATDFYVYHLDADSASAEDSPKVIAPDANAGDKRWVLVYSYGAILSKPVSGDHRVKQIRYKSDGNIKYVYESSAEP